MAHKQSDSTPAYRVSKETPRYDIAEPNTRRPPLHVRTVRASRSIDLMDEESPLLSPASSNDAKSPPRRGSILRHIQSSGEDVQETKSTWYLFLLVLSIGG